MSLSPRLVQKQSQSLVMTPQLAQSIKLLQLGHTELMEFVQKEIEKNPLLELDPDNLGLGKDKRQENVIGESQPSTTEATGDGSPKDAGDLVNSEMKIDAGSMEQNLDASFENVYDGGTAGAETAEKQVSSREHSSSSGSSNHENLDVASLIGEKQSLAQHLESQIAWAFKEDAQRKLALYIAHGLDEDGYFREPLSEAAAHNHTSVEEFEAVLKVFNTLEPAGIGARNLGECLKLQLIDQNRFDPAMETLINNLELLARRDFSTLIKLCGVSEEDFNDMIMEIKALDPRPAAQYEPVLAETVVPDVIISQKIDGSWMIDLNPETLPRVIVNREYHAELSTSVTSEEGQQFVSDCMTNASWLAKTLDQRAQTILKVATEIVKQQDMFFAQGVEHLRPLNLKTVADAIKMHESTISRVTSNKYLVCDQGLFELKYFFSSSISSTDGEEGHSAETVKHKIKQLVNNEDPKKILSDDRIVELLQETGIEIARRTVAKYRDALRIPSSVQRRREKKQLAG